MPIPDEPCRICGEQSVKDEFTAAHCQRLRRWFDAQGRFIGPGATPRTRERLWNCFSLLSDNTESSHELANAIILGTPVDADHFTPTVAANLLLTFKGKLAPDIFTHLAHFLSESVVNRIEVCFGSDAVSNFGAMGAFFLLAAGQILNRYEFDHPHASSAEVYTGDRLTSMGLVKLKAMLWNMENASLHAEFNSPSYTPITLQCMAKIVERVDNPDARLLARRIEGLLWRESLTFYHKNLLYSCGPYSRAYRIDILNMGSSMRKLLRYVGISKDESIVRQLDESRAGILFHHDNDLPFVRSFTGVPGIGFPINFHYALNEPVRGMEDLRTVTAGVMFQSRPDEFVNGADGKRCEANTFTFCGAVECKLTDERNVTFEARPLKELAGVLCDEISLNMFVPLHFGPVDGASLDGMEFAASPLERIFKITLSGCPVTCSQAGVAQSSRASEVRVLWKGGNPLAPNAARSEVYRASRHPATAFFCPSYFSGGQTLLLELRMNAGALGDRAPPLRAHPSFHYSSIPVFRHSICPTPFSLLAGLAFCGRLRHSCPCRGAKAIRTTKRTDYIMAKDKRKLAVNRQKGESTARAARTPSCSAMTENLFMLPGPMTP